MGLFRVASFRLQFLPSLNQVGSSYREAMLLWFKSTLTVRNRLGLNEKCFYRVGNRHFVYKPIGSFRVATIRLQFLPSLNVVGLSCRETMLLWFKSTLTVRKGLGLNEKCFYRVGNRHFVYKPMGLFRVASFRLQFLPSLSQVGSSYRETMLLWFKSTLTVRNRLGLNEKCFYRVGNRHFVYKPMCSFRVASFRLQFLPSLNQVASSYRDTMLLWFKPTLIVRKDLV